jgi:hypothetical protein
MLEITKTPRSNNPRLNGDIIAILLQKITLFRKSIIERSQKLPHAFASDSTDLILYKVTINEGRSDPAHAIKIA